MRVAGLPVVAELGHRLLLAIRDEHRVVAEPLGAARRLGDPPLEDPRPAELLLLWAEEDELADVAGRPDPGRSAQRLDLEPRVLTEHPGLGRPDLPAEKRLAARVLVVAVAPLLRIPLGAQQLEVPVRQERGQLAQLVRVLRAEPYVQSVQRAPSTCSTSASLATTWVASAPFVSSRSSSTFRRSASWLISSACSLAPSCSTAVTSGPGLSPRGS